MGVEPLIALPPRVLVAGRLQCGAARAGVRRGHGECAELAHLARGSSKLFTPRHAENGPSSRGGARNPLQTSSPPLSPGKRSGATAQSALGWYRPSVGVPETLDGKPSGVLV